MAPVDRTCWESNEWVSVSDTKGRNAATGVCVAKTIIQCIENDSLTSTILETNAKDENGSCKTITNTQCWDNSSASVLELSETVSIFSTTFTCGSLTSGNCWENDDNVAVSNTKGRSPKAVDGGKCVALTATQCLNEYGEAESMSNLNAPNNLYQCTILKSNECYNTDSDAIETTTTDKHSHSTNGSCIILRSDQCNENNVITMYDGCKKVRDSDGVCYDITKTECLSSSDSGTTVTNSKIKHNVTGACIDFSIIKCIDPFSTSTSAKTISQI